MQEWEHLIIFYYYREVVIIIARTIFGYPIPTEFNELVSSQSPFIALERNKKPLLYMDFRNYVTTDPGQNCQSIFSPIY